MLAWVVHIPVLSAIIILYYKYRGRDSLLKPFFLPALLFKLLCGILVGLLYTYYYQGGDTFALFADASKLSDLLHKNPTSFIKFIFFNENDTSVNLLYTDQPRALFTVKILAFISWLSFKNYWISGLWLSLFSFCGMWSLVKTLTHLFSKTAKPAVFSFLFLPSPVLFGSGVTKESICLGSIGFIVSYMLLFAHRRVTFTSSNAVFKYTVIIVAAFILLKIKFYVAVILIPILLFYTIIEVSGIKKLNNHKKISIFILIFFSFIILVYLVSPCIYTNIIPETMAASHNKILVESGNKNLTFKNTLTPSWESILERLPASLVAGLFRPVIGEKGNILVILAEIEGLFFILTLLLAALFLIRHRLALNIDGFVCIFYVILTASVLGLTVPNIGSLFRHKSVFLPFLWFLTTQTLITPKIFRRKTYLY